MTSLKGSAADVPTTFGRQRAYEHHASCPEAVHELAIRFARLEAFPKVIVTRWFATCRKRGKSDVNVPLNVTFLLTEIIAHGPGTIPHVPVNEAVESHLLVSSMNRAL
jgi:hypothetical protein